MRSETWDKYDETHRQGAGVVTLPPMIRALGRVGVFHSILDVGCGDGGTLAAIRRSDATYGLVLGVEMSQTRARRASKFAPAALGDAQILPVKDAAFDVVVSRHVIEHVPDDLAMARELVRVCRPGGFIYVETPLKRSGATYFYRSESGKRVLDPTHLREYRSVEELERLFLQAGASVVVTDVARLTYPLGDLVLRVLSLLGFSLRGVRYRHIPIPIPRYGEIRLLVERTLPEQTS